MSCHRSVLRLCMFALFFSLAWSVNAYAAARGSVNGDSVNVRLNPSTDAVIIAKINNGQDITVTSKDGEYYRVDYLDLKDVYLSVQFVDITATDAMINSDAVNVRSYPSTDDRSQVIAKFNKGDMIYVTGFVDNWYEVMHNGVASYISKEFVSGDFLSLVKPKQLVFTAQQAAAEAVPMIFSPEQQAATLYALVTSDNGLNLRMAPSAESPVLCVLPFSSAAQVAEVTGEWVKVLYEAQYGFLSSEFVEIKNGVMPTQSKGQEVITFAKKFIGTPYLWAGTNLQKGVDCSGFVYAVFKNFGITLNRSSADMAANGREVSKNELKAGDLVLFSSSVGSKAIGHVGIYIGNGDFIHSASGSVNRGVIISSLNEDFYIKTYKTARRIFD